MHIDWAQLVTHVIGFLIALWILKRYAWGPILKLIDERRENIRLEIANAEEARRQAEENNRQLEGKLREVDSQVRQRIQEGVAEGQRVAAEIKESARTDAQALIERAKEEIGRERDKARAALREDLVNLALAAAEKVVEEKMDETRDRELARGFLDQVEKLQ